MGWSPWALAAALCIVCGCGERPRAPRDPDPGAFHFTVATYNVLDDDPGDPATLDALGRTGADVVCLQETTAEWQAAIEAAFASRYPYRMFNAPLELGGAGALGILSRFPLRDGGWHEAYVPWWHPAWHFLVDTPAGTMKILNLHLRNATSDHGGTVESYVTTAEDHLAEIQDWSSQNEAALPSLVVGDFNEEAGGAAVRWLEAVGYANALPLFHPGQPTCRHRSLADEFWIQIDHVLFDGSFEPLDAFTINAGGSDHFPVVAHLQAIGGAWIPPRIPLTTALRAPLPGACDGCTPATPPSSSAIRREATLPGRSAR